MAGWQRNMWILWACVLLCSASYTMCVPFLPLFLYELGVTGTAVHLWAGLVLSASFLVGVVMGPFWGILSDRYGKRKMIIRAGLSLVAVYLLFTIVRSPWELLGVRLLHGFVAGFIPASMALVASTAPKEKLGEALGYMQAAAMSGGILGPLLGGVLSSAFGMRESFAAAAAIVLLSALSVILFVREAPPAAAGEAAAPAEEEGETGGASTLGEWLRTPVLLGLLGLLFLYQLAVNTIQPVLSLHLAELQGQLKDAALTSGIVLALAGAAGILASPWWGKARGGLGRPADSAPVSGRRGRPAGASIDRAERRHLLGGAVRLRALHRRDRAYREHDDHASYECGRPGPLVRADVERQPARRPARAACGRRAGGLARQLLGVRRNRSGAVRCRSGHGRSASVAQPHRSAAFPVGNGPRERRRPFPLRRW